MLEVGGFNEFAVSIEICAGGTLEGREEELASPPLPRPLLLWRLAPEAETRWTFNADAHSSAMVCVTSQCFFLGTNVVFIVFRQHVKPFIKLDQLLSDMRVRAPHGRDPLRNDIAQELVRLTGHQTLEQAPQLVE